MDSGSVYKNKYTDEELTLQIYMVMAGIGLFMDDNNEEIAIYSLELINNWELQT